MCKVAKFCCKTISCKETREKVLTPFFSSFYEKPDRHTLTIAVLLDAIRIYYWAGHRPVLFSDLDNASFDTECNLYGFG